MEFRKWVFLYLLFVVGIHGNKACLEPERLALIEFKTFLNSKGYDADYLFPSWKDDPRSECCEWERVSCNGNTGHVTNLSLDDIRKLSVEDSYSKAATWFFDISMFHHFNQLQVLDLSNNRIEGWTRNKGFGSSLRLKKLEMLDLSWNHFDEGVITSLKGLSSLKKLNLPVNSVKQFPAKGLDYSSDLRKLNHLDLSSNDLPENIFSFLCKLLSLEYLDLSANYYGGIFPLHNMSGLTNLKVLLLDLNEIGGSLFIRNWTVLPKLQVLDLSNNNLTNVSLASGALISITALSTRNNQLDDSAISEFCGLKMLKELDLSVNHFTIIPQCLHSLTSLELLDLSHNAISGEIPSSWIAELTSLRYIDLWNNNFQGLFSFSTFNNHSQLELVRLGSCQDSFRVETEDAEWIPKFQLKYLALYNCTLNNLNHEAPTFLLQQHKLTAVDLSHNNLTGTFPGWLLVNNSRMQFFSLGGNSFTGNFYMSEYPMRDLIWFDISDNHIEGMLPENVGNILPNLILLNLSNNDFGGNLPASVALTGNLQYLDLSFNNFIGEIPKSLLTCTSLIILKLSNNRFSGIFFSTHYHLSDLMVLLLNDNNFTGSMSGVEVNSYGLKIFDISNNNIYGRVPTWIANLKSLHTVILRNNSLEGEVPCEGFARTIVDFSQNLLSGVIPSCSTMERLNVLHLQSNNFTGSIPDVLLNSSTLLLLNLRDNRLHGSIPEITDDHFSSLKVLLLGANRLSGLIPKNLCFLKNITLLDLSHKSLSGSIPLCLSNISFGSSDPSSIFDAGMPFYYNIGKGYQPSEYTNSLEKSLFVLLERNMENPVATKVDFVTKNRNYTYKGDILNYMTGLDLSDNNLTSEIPSGLGSLSGLRAMNLSHNNLTGLIPTSFGNLATVESLDLSHNSLSGNIPIQLTKSTFLAVFSVAYNNLSGRIPYGTAQFSTFERSSYEGNPLLCGKPLEKQCSGDNKPVPPPPMPLLSNDGDEHWYGIDAVTFFASFSSSFAILFLGVIAFLYVNPYWRQWVFYYGEKIVLSGYHFVSDTVFLLSLRFRRG